MKEIFNRIFRDGSRIYTTNLVPGKRAYGEKLIDHNSKEMREWDPARSKLGAAVANGLKEMPIKPGSIVLYLGASTGTTISHVSDIVSAEGFVYGIEFAERVFRSLTDLANQRKNIAAVKADARKPEEYEWIEECDVVISDIAQPDETEISIRNCRDFLKSGGYLFLSVKSQSIDVTKKPREIYDQEKDKLIKAGFSIVQVIDLEPHEQKHAMIVAKA